MYRLSSRHVQATPAAVAQPLGEVDLVGVDEEVGIEVVDLRRRLAPDEQRRGLAPIDLTRLPALALHCVEAVQEEGAGERREGRREAPGACLLPLCPFGMPLWGLRQTGAPIQPPGPSAPPAAGRR